MYVYTRSTGESYFAYFAYFVCLPNAWGDVSGCLSLFTKRSPTRLLGSGRGAIEETAPTTLHPHSTRSPLQGATDYWGNNQGALTGRRRRRRWRRRRKRGIVVGQTPTGGRLPPEEGGKATKMKGSYSKACERRCSRYWQI